MVVNQLESQHKKKTNTRHEGQPSNKNADNTAREGR